MNQDEIAVLERAERDGWRDLYAAPPPALAARFGIRGGSIAGVVCGAVDRLPDSRMLNHAGALGVDAPADDAALDAVERFYGRGGFVVSAAPSAGGLEERLRARGYVPDYAWAKFRRPLDGLPATPETPLRLMPVGDEHREAFGRVVVEGFGLPAELAPWHGAVPGRERWRCFLAVDPGGEPAGAGSIYLGHEGVAWMGFGAVLPAFRGRRGQAALIAARLRAAAEAGCHAAATETGVRLEGRPSFSYANIERAGFAAVYERPNWRAP